MLGHEWKQCCIRESVVKNRKRELILSHNEVWQEGCEVCTRDVAFDSSKRYLRPPSFYGSRSYDRLPRDLPYLFTLLVWLLANIHERKVHVVLPCKCLLLFRQPIIT